MTRDEKMDPKVWHVAAVVLLGPFMSQMDSTVVNVSLSTIGQELHASIASAQWIISGYLLALALMLPLNGWLVDRVGAKRLYLISFASFTLTSALCGFARNIDELIWARLLQGMAGGLLAPLTQLMIARIAGTHMARVIGVTTAPVLLAPILGPIVAGTILKVAPWPWLFYVNVPIGMVAVLLSYLLLPNDDDTMERRPFDLLGFLLISPGLGFCIYALEHTSQVIGRVLLPVGAVLITGFILHARRKPDMSLIDLRLFAIKTFRAASRTQFFLNGAIYAGQMLVPLYLISGCGFSAAQAGWLLTPMGLGMLCTYPFMGFITEKFGCRLVSATGASLALLGTLPFLWMLHSGYSHVITMICMLARGAGQGAIGIPSIAAAYGAVNKNRISAAATALNIVQRLGGPVATTAIAIVMAEASHSESKLAEQSAFLPAFIALIILHTVVVASALRLPKLIYR